MIATIATRARERGIDVMVVTGDRDMFQLVEPRRARDGHRRGITDTKIYDREAVVDRYGIPPELIPDFYGLKGDTSDNIPGVPGIGDKTASQLLQRFGTLETVLAHVDEISRRQAQGEPPQPRRRRPHVEASSPQRCATSGGGRPRRWVSTEPDRSRLRETFREFELRDPLRRIEEALGDTGRGRGAALCHGDDSRSAPSRSPVRARAGGRGAGDARRRAAGRAGGRGRGRGRTGAQPAARVRRVRGRRRGARGRPETLAALALSWGDPAGGGARLEGDRPAKTLLDDPPLEHDTMVAAYLLDPAGRAYPSRELAEDRRRGADGDGGHGAGRARGPNARAGLAAARGIEERG